MTCLWNVKFGGKISEKASTKKFGWVQNTLFTFWLEEHAKT